MIRMHIRRVCAGLSAVRERFNVAGRLHRGFGQCCPVRCRGKSFGRQARLSWSRCTNVDSECTPISILLKRSFGDLTACVSNLDAMQPLVRQLTLLQPSYSLGEKIEVTFNVTCSSPRLMRGKNASMSRLG